HENTNKFVANPLPGYLFQLRCVLCDPRGSLCIDGKVEFGGYPYRSKCPEGVFREPLIGIADRDDHLSLQIFGAVMFIDDRFGRRIICDRIDSEISPIEVVFKAFAEFDLIRMTGVRVFPLDAIWRNL